MEDEGDKFMEKCVWFTEERKRETEKIILLKGCWVEKEVRFKQSSASNALAIASTKPEAAKAQVGSAEEEMEMKKRELD